MTAPPTRLHAAVSACHISPQPIPRRRKSNRGASSRRIDRGRRRQMGLDDSTTLVNTTPTPGRSSAATRTSSPRRRHHRLRRCPRFTEGERRSRNRPRPGSGRAHSVLAHFLKRAGRTRCVVYAAYELSVVCMSYQFVASRILARAARLHPSSRRATADR
jgi:hypothetical protein